MLPLPVALLLFRVGTPVPLTLPLPPGELDTVRVAVALTTQERVNDREAGRLAELLALPELLLLPVAHTDRLMEVEREREAVGEREGLTVLVLDRVSVDALELLGGRVREEQGVEEGDWEEDLVWDTEVVKLGEPLGDLVWDRLEVSLREPLEHPLEVPPFMFVVLRVRVPPPAIVLVPALTV